MNKYMDGFMKAFPYEGLTYDDVTLVTQYADFLPDEASLETRLTGRMKMKIPFMSAAMDIFALVYINPRYSRAVTISGYFCK